uniref:response regulator n=1 Tax=Arenibaculum pallidiluteum TaxID=2812559 RepID=UPI001A962F1F|nr:response regulator transcription factor [Arenibaculum pallidiluteum]
MACRVLIADDHPLMRAALRQAVDQSVEAPEIVEAADFDQVGAALTTGPGADVVLLDLNMPGASGLVGLAMLRAEHPATPVIVVSATEDAATIHRAMEFGASGFVPKSAPIAQIGDAIRAVLDGEIWSPPLSATPEEDIQLAERVASLTPQQLRVLAGIVAGKLNKQIAYEMNVAEATVKGHITVILRRLGVVTRTQAAVIASRLMPGGTMPVPE